MVLASGGRFASGFFCFAPFAPGWGEAFFADDGGEVSCATIESCVCFETSEASSLASIVVSAAAGSGGGGGPPASCTASTVTPRTFPPVSASAKFIRVSSADELTQVSAFMEYPVGGCAP